MSAEKKPQINFLENSGTVAWALIGAQVEINGRTVEITETEDFTRDENDTPQFRIVFKRNPGDLLIAPFMHHELPLVVTAEGGCVLIRGGRYTQPDGSIEEVKRPAVLAKKLGLPRGAVYHLEVVDQQARILRATLL